MSGSAELDDWVPAGSAAPAQAPVTHEADGWVPAAPPGGGSGVGRGLIAGASGLLGIPGDIYHAADRAWQNVITRGGEKLGLWSPDEGAAMRAPMTTAAGEDMETQPLSSESINKNLLSAAKSTGANINPPKTTAGKYAETVTSFLPAAVTMGESTLPGIAKAALKYGVVPGVTSEAAGEATEGTPLEPYARLAGAAGPAALEAAASIPKAVFGNPLRDAMAGATPAQLADAQRLLDESRAGVAPITTAEALQKAAGGPSPLGDIQRVVEQSPKGGAIMKPFFAERGPQTQAAGQAMLGEIAPAGADPYAVAPRVQAAAQTTVDQSPEGRALAQSVYDVGPRTTAEEAGNVIRAGLQNIYDRREGMRAALGNADYGAARAADYTTNGEAANPVTIRPVIDHIDDLLTSAKGPTAAALRQVRATLFSNGQPDMSVTGLSNARDVIGDQISEAVRAGNNNQARVLSDVQGQLDYALEQVPAYGLARRNFAAASQPLAPFAEGTAPGRILDRDQYGNNYTMPTEQVAPAIQKGGATAADQFVAAAENAPDARRAFGRYYAQRLVESAQNNAGRIDPDKLTSVIQQNQDMLQRFPEARMQLNQIGAARTALQNVERAPIGRLAATDQPATQRTIMFNQTDPLPNSEGTIGATVRAVAAQDPEAAQQFVRQHLEQAFNKAMASGTPGGNQFGGGNFFTKVMGDPQQAKNIEAAVRALPNGATRWAAAQKTMDIFQAMKMRQAVGSQTAYNAQMNKLLEADHPGGEALAVAGSPGKWLSLTHDLYQRFAYGQNTEAWARVLTQGNIKDLQALVGAAPTSLRAQGALVGMLARQGAIGGPPSDQPQQ